MYKIDISFGNKKQVVTLKGLDYETYKSKTYNSYSQAWREYRNMKAERLADEFAAIIMKNQTIKIWSLMNKISEEEAEEEFKFWSE